jgi:hypothetical protein
LERWAENTLRTIGILVLSGVVLIASGLLLLLSICASGGSFSGTKNPGAAFGYLLGAVVVFGLGVYSIVRLARGFFRSSQSGNLSQQVPQTQIPAVFTLTPEVRRATQLIVYLIIAKLVTGYLGWLFLTKTSAAIYTPRLTVVIATFFVSQLPFIILGAVLLMRPSAAALTFTLVFTAISLLRLLPTLQFFVRGMYRSPGTFALTLIALITEVAIIALTYKAMQKANARPQPATIVVAVVTTLIYFSVVSIASPILYRLR